MTDALRHDAITGVETIFGDMAVFSCLTGSVVDAPSNSPGPDIDLVIVLRDDLDLTDALAGRIEFTRFYMRLHRDHGHVPDLQWPGEVLYQRELNDALLGATFNRNRQLGAAPALCTSDEPYRYWVSMVATGHPLTGARAFRYYAHACARLVATHAAAVLTIEDSEPDRYWAENWHLPVPTDADRTWRIARQTRDSSIRLAQLTLRPPKPSAMPELERYADNWAQIARDSV